MIVLCDTCAISFTALDVSLTNNILKGDAYVPLHYVYPYDWLMHKGQGSIQFHIQCLLEASSPGVTEMKYLGVKRTTHLHLELKEFMELYLCSSIHFSDIVLY